MKTPKVKLPTKVAAKVALINARASASLKRSQGKAIRQNAKRHETELTKRSLARSAAAAKAIGDIAKARSEENQAQAALKQSTDIWNKIINGNVSDNKANQDTSDNQNNSTTSTDRIN